METALYREGHLDFVPGERHPGNRSDLDPVDRDDVTALQTAGIGEVCRIARVVVDERELRELERADDEDEGDDDPDEAGESPVAFAEAFHWQVAVWSEMLPTMPDGRFTGSGYCGGLTPGTSEM